MVLCKCGHSNRVHKKYIGKCISPSCSCKVFTMLGLVPEKVGCYGYNALGGIVFLHCVDCEHQHNESACQEIQTEHDTEIVWKKGGEA